jgi:hypothetical protein
VAVSFIAGETGIPGENHRQVENSVRNIFVISDGHVNNEETTLRAVHDNCQHTRIFTFGVRYVLSKKDVLLTNKEVVFYISILKLS